MFRPVVAVVITAVVPVVLTAVVPVVRTAVVPVVLTAVVPVVAVVAVVAVVPRDVNLNVLCTCCRGFRRSKIDCHVYCIDIDSYSTRCRNKLKENKKFQSIHISWIRSPSAIMKCYCVKSITQLLSQKFLF